MGVSKYRMNKNMQRFTVVSVLVTCFFFTLHFLRTSPTELFVVNSPFHYSDISKYTHIFTSILSPNCPALDEYERESRNYWQYYGFQHHMKLDEDSLSNILRVSDEQENALGRVHSELMNKYLHDEHPLYQHMRKQVERNNKPNNKGIVYVSGKNYYWLTMVSIKYIRDVLKDKETPIEIFVPFRVKNDHHCSKIEKVFSKVKCSYFTDHLTKTQIRQIKGYQYKALALLLTQFNEILYLDSDNIPISNIGDMFENQLYKKNGFISWADFWKRSTNYKYYKIAGLSRFANPISTTPSVESGQILINKSTHLKTLLLAYYYNLYGPEYFYPLFSQGFPGEGDKETFYLASRASNEPSYLINGHKTKSFGYTNKEGKYTGQGILQGEPSNPDNFWFLHMNYPKLYVNKLLKSGYFDKEKKRHWTKIRHAHDDGKTSEFKKSAGKDLEYEIWKIMDELLSTDFKGFQVFKDIGNDEMADYVKLQMKTIKNQL